MGKDITDHVFTQSQIQIRTARLNIRARLQIGFRKKHASHYRRRRLGDFRQLVNLRLDSFRIDFYQHG